MSKKDEKIIISKQLATDLIWWLENASAPCLTIREVQERWYQLFSDPQLTLARDSMKAELEKALVANVEVAYEPVDHVTHVGKKVVLTAEEAKRLDNLIERINDDIVLSDTEMVFWITLQAKIKQAEKENETE